jgi:hypothetical protein
MPRQRLFTPAEQQAFDAPPILNAGQRHNYFAVSAELGELITSLRTPVNQGCFLVQLGYFRVAHRFFSYLYPPYGVAYVARRLSVLPHTVDVSSYDEATARRHRRLILEHVGYRPFDGDAK